MKRSSAAQLELNYVDSSPIDQRTTSGLDAPASQALETENAESADLTSSQLKVPSFDKYAEWYAITSRIAGRINAASVSEQEHNALLRERQNLLDKKLNGSISPKDANRLEYVRWSLDRIEDAKYGQALDALDLSVSKYERFLTDLEGLKEQLSQRLGKKNK